MNSIIIYTLYLPTSGQDEDFIEVIDTLQYDILKQHPYTALIIGTDSNVSMKSTKRRQKAMEYFYRNFPFYLS